MAGYLLVGSHRGVEFSVGGEHMRSVYGGGAISLAVVGHSHVWCAAAKLNCIQTHWFGWSSASSILLPGWKSFSGRGRLGG